MKKFAFLLSLLIVLSSSGVADDGQYPLGGRTCPQGQICRPAPAPVDKPVYKDIFDFLTSLFG